MHRARRRQCGLGLVLIGRALQDERTPSDSHKPIGSPLVLVAAVVMIGLAISGAFKRGPLPAPELASQKNDCQAARAARRAGYNGARRPSH